VGGLTVTAAIGVWAQGDTTGDHVLYRWEADQQQGFLIFEVTQRRFRPADETGTPIGSLEVDASADATSGSAEGVNKRLFVKAVASILKRHNPGETPPKTAHAYYY
jgi:hypothetical protein